MSARTLIGLGCLLLATDAPARAQDGGALGSRVTVDTVVGGDRYDTGAKPGWSDLVFDGLVTVRLSPALHVRVQPWARRLPNGDWTRQMYQFALEYQPATRLPVRIDAGFLSSPIGLGSLSVRADRNPTISFHPFYFARLPAFEAGTPVVQPISAAYPLGVQAAASSTHWDARVALLDSSPVRPRKVFSSQNPPRMPQLVAGAGFAPFAGLRVGGAIAHGAYARRREVVDSSRGDRAATLVGAELEYSVRYTKVSAELMRDTFETASGRAVAHSWYVEGTQTLSPRWFVAGRFDRLSSPPSAASRFRGTVDSTNTEGVAGFRVTPDVTLRGGVLARRPLGTSTWERQTAVSVVFARRWW